MLLHDILLKILQNYEVTGITGITQILKVAEIRSKPVNIDCGVPQGTKLRPLLFVIYINGMLKLMGNGEMIACFDDIRRTKTKKN